MGHESKALGVVAHTTGAPVKVELWANTSGAFARHSSEQPRAGQRFEYCQWCGLWLPVAWWILITFMEYEERHAWAGLCADCRDRWKAGVERRRAGRRRRG